MGYAPPPAVGGYGFVPPVFPPGMNVSQWPQLPPPQFTWEPAGRQDFNTNNGPQASQSDYYRSRSPPRGNSRGGGHYNDYSGYGNSNGYNNTRQEPDYYRPRSPVGPSSYSGGGGGGRRFNNNHTGSDSYRPGPYSRGGGGRQYHSEARLDRGRPRSPGPYSGDYSTHGGAQGQYNNSNNYNNNHNPSQHQQQQQQLPPKPQQQPAKPPKLNKKAKAREAAAREALRALAKPQPQSQSQASYDRGASMIPNHIFNQKGDIPRTHSEPIVPPSKASGGVPNPSSYYLKRASVYPVAIPEDEPPRPLLVVIDLNGTLLHRPSRKRPSKFVERPFAKDFVRYCLEHFKVVIWSSARPLNVDLMCKQLLTADQLNQVVAIWGRDKFGLTQHDYNARVQCYKRLTRLWADESVKAHPAGENGEVWDQGNTVLIDDSAEKARSEPYNCITLPEFVGDLGEKPQVLPKVREYLDTLARQEDISRYIRTKPFNINVDSSEPVNGEEGVATASPPAADQSEGSG